MKVFIIKNKISEDVFVVKNKTRFCDKFGLTPRLLDYTVEGASSTRHQEWHKNYKIIDKAVFMEDKNGDRTLWDTGLLGFCLKEDGKHFKDTAKSNTVKMEDEILSLQKELNKVLKQKQKLQDQLNINRRLGREQYRYENFVEVLKNSCRDIINSNKDRLSNIYFDNNSNSVSETAILTLSDLHFGQIVNESNNYFDSEIADIRLGKIFKQFEYEVEMRGIKDVYILFLGDLIHAQSITTKPDMKIASEMPEVQSSIQCFLVLSKYIDRLVEKYNVYIGGVIGNESRFNNHLIPSNLQNEAQNNMDVVIFEFIKQRYRNIHNVEFLNEGNEIESVVWVKDKNILMTHGYDLNHSNLEKDIIGMRTRLEKVYGEIDFCVLGHIHSAYISDRFARNSSLVGSNAYSNRKGFIESTVSQNMIILGDYGFKVFSLKA